MTRQVITGVVLWMALGNAVACTPPPFNTTEVQRAEIVALGVVERAAPPSSSYEMAVWIQPVETLKGSAQPRMEAISPCALPMAPGQRVIVLKYRSGALAYGATEYAEALTRRALHRERP